MMRFDRFTERAQDAAMRAYEILQRFHHSQADTEHLFLALLEQTDGLIPQILESLGVEPDAIHERVERVLEDSPKSRGPDMGPMAVGQVYITPRLKRVLDHSNEEANRLNDEYISTEHIFLAICSERGTPTARILQESGVSRERVLDAIEEIRGGQRVTSPQAEAAIAPWRNTAVT